MALIIIKNIGVEFDAALSDTISFFVVLSVELVVSITGHVLSLAAKIIFIMYDIY